MTIHVHTARIDYAGPDRLDVTRKSADEWGKSFAPSWATLRPVLDARKIAASMVVPSDYLDDAWREYVPRFMFEMRKSYRERRADWERLLAMPRVVLCCYCSDRDQCHRTILAREILPKLGAVYCGELTAEKSRQKTL